MWERWKLLHGLMGAVGLVEGAGARLLLRTLRICIKWSIEQKRGWKVLDRGHVLR